MAKSVKINGTTYSNVPYINVPLSTGTGNAVFYETSTATATAAHILQGYVAYGSAGSVTGTLSTPTVSQDSTSKALTIS